jgi:formylmethanofuran dehydrogenase subunit E
LIQYTDLEAAKIFHGHIGPCLVIGMKMGYFAVSHLNARRHFGIQAEVRCPARPPVSCMIDGIQLSTGCTMGKANITHAASDGEVSVSFTNTDTNNTIVLGLMPELIDTAFHWCDKLGEEAASARIWEMDDDMVFVVCAE